MFCPIGGLVYAFDDSKVNPFHPQPLTIMVHLRTALLILLPYCSSFLLTPPAAFGVNERSRSLASTKTPEEVDQEITALLDEEVRKE